MPGIEPLPLGCPVRRAITVQVMLSFNMTKIVLKFMTDLLKLYFITVILTHCVSTTCIQFWIGLK